MTLYLVVPFPRPPIISMTKKPSQNPERGPKACGCLSSTIRKVLSSCQKETPSLLCQPHHAKFTTQGSKTTFTSVKHVTASRAMNNSAKPSNPSNEQWRPSILNLYSHGRTCFSENWHRDMFSISHGPRPRHLFSFVLASFTSVMLEGSWHVPTNIRSTPQCGIGAYRLFCKLY